MGILVEGGVITTSAEFGITFDVLKLILLKNTTLFVCLFSWQIRAVISKGTRVRQNILQPFTLPVFPAYRDVHKYSHSQGESSYLI